MARCQLCVATEQNLEDWRGVSEHHIQYRSHLGGNEPENLISLCGVHHARIHERKQDYTLLVKLIRYFQENGLDINSL